MALNKASDSEDRVSIAPLEPGMTIADMLRRAEGPRLVFRERQSASF
jgi:hypothetical protein